MSGKTPMKAADAEFSRQVREAGECFAGGVKFPCSGYLQAAHIIGRRYRAIRWNRSNALCLCSAHHVHWTHRPLEWQVFIEENLPGRWDSLRWAALHGPPEKPKDALERLKKEAA